MVPNPARTRGQLSGWEFDSSALLFSKAHMGLKATGVAAWLSTR